MAEPEDIDQFLYGDEGKPLVSMYSLTYFLILANFIQQMSANEVGQEESAMQITDEPANDLAEADVNVTAKEEGEEDDESEEEEEELEIVLDGSSGPAK